MRRPVLWLAAVFLTGMLLAGGYVAVVICACVVFLGMWLMGDVLWGVKWRYIGAAALMFVIGFVRMRMEIPREAFGYLEEGRYVNVRGEVSSISEGYGYMVTLKGARVTCDKECFIDGILVYTSDASGIGPGDVIAVSGTLSSFDLPRNDGEFNTYEYYKSQGIYYKLEADGFSVVSGKNGLAGRLLELREYLRDRIFEYSFDAKDAGTMTAMLLGDKSYLDKELKADFQDIGISHILVVSGLHISLLGMGIFRLLRKMFKYGVSCSVASVCVVLYVIMTGFGVSGRRALIMFLISMLAEYLGRTYEMLTSISVALVIILFDTPYLFLNCGFLLSFLAVMGIATLVPVLEDVSKWLCGHSLSFVMVSIAVAWATLPVSSWFFYEYPIFSIFVNLIVIPCMPFLVILGVVSVGGELACGHGEILLKGPAHLVLALFEKIGDAVAAFEENMVLIGKPLFACTLTVYMLLICITAIHMIVKQLIKRNFKFPKVCRSFVFKLCVWIVLVAGVSLVEIYVLKLRNVGGELRITMIDVGQGDSFFVELPNGETMLIDCGSSDVGELYIERVEGFLKSHGVRQIDYIMVSHGDEDHCNALADILGKGSGVEVVLLMLPEVSEDDMLGKLQTLAQASGAEVMELKKGEDFSIGEVSFDVLNPIGKVAASDDKNDNSLVVILSYGEFDMIFTGDIGTAREAVIASGLRECEVLKVAHHGSKYSSGESFLDVVSPEIALISCGEGNSYGHPHAETIERLRECGAKVYITAEFGQVVIESDGEGVKVYE